MSRLQIQLLGPYFGSFSAHSYVCIDEIDAHAFLTNSDFNFIAPIPSILQSIL